MFLIKPKMYLFVIIRAPVSVFKSKNCDAIKNVVQPLELTFKRTISKNNQLAKNKITL